MNKWVGSEYKREQRRERTIRSKKLLAARRASTASCALFGPNTRRLRSYIRRNGIVLGLFLRLLDGPLLRLALPLKLGHPLLLLLPLGNPGALYTLRTAHGCAAHVLHPSLKHLYALAGLATAELKRKRIQ